MKRILVGVALLTLAAWLLVPAGSPAVPPPANARPFVWDQNQLWRALEADFSATRNGGCESASKRVETGLGALADDVAWLEAGDHSPFDTRYDAIERDLFSTAPLVAACPERLSSMVDVVSRLRAAVKRNSRSWTIRDRAVRDRLYRLPYGAPVSALIARGNDYPGNFSHIALLRIAEQHVVSVIEAHIEVGVAISALGQYLADNKLRIMVLRLDDSLPLLRADPMLPYRAATAALTEARRRHIPYDFAMHYQDPDKLFHSEVASTPHAKLGVGLWEGLTTMSSKLFFTVLQ